MKKLRLIAMLVIFLISLLAPEAQGANHLPETTILFPAQQQDDTPRPAQLGENRGQIPEGSSEVWTYEGKVGDVLTIKAEADKPANDTDAEERRQAGLLDMMLIINAPDGNIMAKADDIQPGTVTDSVIKGLQLPTDGTYEIEVLGLEKEGSGAYTLTLEADNATPADPTPTPDPDWPTLTIENQLEEAICYVYIWPTSSDEFGDEWLGTKKVILANDSHQWAVAPDSYHIVLSDCYGNTLEQRWNFDVTNSSTLTISPLDGPAAQCAEGVQLFFDGKASEALPLLEAGVAGREKGTFADPDDEGRCALALGLLRRRIGNRSSALSAFQVALEIFQASGNRTFEGTTLNNIGAVYDNLGQHELALEQYQQALAIRREVSDRAGEGTTLHNIALIYHAQGQYELALEQFQEVLLIMREVSDRAGEGVTLTSIGRVYLSLGQYELALEQFQPALAIRRQVGDRAGEGTILNNIGEVYLNQGQYELALEQSQQALEINREVGDRAGESTSLNNMGVVYGERGQYELALEQFQQALEINREVGDRAGEGTTTNNIGAIYNSQGQYELALEQFQQALEISREVGDRAGEGETLSHIGTVYLDLGQYELALEQHQQALAIRREVGDRAGESLVLNNIGLIYFSISNYKECLRHYKISLEITREVGNRALEGATLHNIGTVYYVQGQYELALEQFNQALFIAREVGDRPGEGTILSSIGEVYGEWGQYELALEHLNQALAIRREAGERAGEGVTLNSTGAVYHDQGQYELALEQFNQALAIAREVGYRALEGSTLGNIGFAYEQQGQAEKALVYYEQAMDVFESIRAVAGSEEQRASFIAEHADIYYFSVGLYDKQGQDEEAFLTSERGRARSFLDSLVTGKVQLSDEELQALVDQEREAYDKRFAIQDQLARVRAQNPPDQEFVADLEQQLAEVEQAHSAALSAIEARGGQLADLVPGRTKRVSLSEIQADLPENTTLVSYHILGEEETLAFILTPDELKVVPLGVGSQDLTEQIKAFSFSFAHPDLDSVDAHKSEALQQLHEWLITPLKPHLNTPGVTIIPHSILHYLPFAALTDGENYFSDQYVLSTLPSASVLPSIQENRKPDTTIESVLALGNPTFDPELVAQEGLTLSNLPFAKQEVETLTDLFGDQVEAHFGTEASESTLAQAGKANILHIAAHGVYNPQQPLNSKLFLAPDSDATNDGVLEVGEVYGLELTDATLVVLSACETGLRSLNKGDSESIITDGDEIVALNRAFLFAGTPSVLSTLWVVDDEATARLMGHFYTHLHDGKGKAEALRQAQIDVREEYPHPYYWAGFVLSGDGGEVTSDLPSGNDNSSDDNNNEATPVIDGSAGSEPESVATKSAEESVESGSGANYPCLGAFLLLGVVAVGGMSRKRLRA